MICYTRFLIFLVVFCCHLESFGSFALLQRNGFSCTMYLPTHRLNLSGLMFLFILSSSSTFASEPYAIWVYPAWGPDATTLNYLDTINVSWKSNYPNPYLARRCESKPQVWTRCTSPETELLPPSPKLNISTRLRRPGQLHRNPPPQARRRQHDPNLRP